MNFRRLSLVTTSILLSTMLVACGGSGPDLEVLATEAADVQPQTELTVLADGLEFDTDTLVVSASADLSITLDNRDNALHNIAVYFDGEDGREEVYRGELFNGDDVRTYEFTAPVEGLYLFRCDAHPDMNGVFIAK